MENLIWNNLLVTYDKDNIYIYIYIYIWWLECSPMARETGVQSQVQSYQRLKKWYLVPPCLTVSIIRWGSRVKWSNLGKGVAPSLIPWCSSYWKGSLWVTLDNGRQLYNLYIYIYIYIITFKNYNTYNTKLMTMYLALHLRDDRNYVSGLANTLTITYIYIYILSLS